MLLTPVEARVLDVETLLIAGLVTCDPATADPKTGRDPAEQYYWTRLALVVAHAFWHRCVGRQLESEVDDADLAQIFEERERDDALAAVLEHDPGQPCERNGVRYCIDCGDAIDPRRLLARPNAIRCADCQGIHEQRQGVRCGN
jgi:DnaK suppressor protein